MQWDEAGSGTASATATLSSHETDDKSGRCEKKIEERRKKKKRPRVPQQCVQTQNSSSSNSIWVAVRGKKKNAPSLVVVVVVSVWLLNCDWRWSSQRRNSQEPQLFDALVVLTLTREWMRHTSTSRTERRMLGARRPVFVGFKAVCCFSYTALLSAAAW